MKRIILKVRSGKMISVYDDIVFPFMKKLGKTKVNRATHVEFDNKKGKWVAKTARTLPNNWLGDGITTAKGSVICETDSRQEAIEREVEFLNRNL